MIKHLLLLLSVSFASTLFGQTYTFSSFAGGYSDLVGSTSLNNGQTWDDPNYTVPIGFTFEFFGEAITSIDISDEGLGGLLKSGNCSTDPTVSFLIAYGADIIDRGDDGVVSLSNISYKTEGTAGNRICKVEWNNVGFFDGSVDANGNRIDYLNFQLWLFETSNAIEIRFGPKSITEPLIDFEGETGSYVALLHNWDCNNSGILGHQLMLGGTPANPDLYDNVYNLSDTLLYLDGVIPPSTVYRFVPASTASEEEVSSLVTMALVPNPAEDVIRIVLSEGSVADLERAYIIGMNGQIMMNLENVSTDISIVDLDPGIYFLRVETKSGGVYSEKFTKR